MSRTSLGTEVVNIDVLEILRRGPIEWNQWREENFLISVDLSYARLSKARLNGVNLNGVNLYKTDLGSAQLDKADLSNTQLSQANLNGASLNDVNLGGADLSNADLRLADLSGVNLCRADLNQTQLNGADLNQADLHGTSLIQARLNGADLSQADLRSADLSHANLSNVNFSNADLRGTNFNKAYLNNVNFSGTKLGINNLVRYKLGIAWKNLNTIPEQGYHSFNIRIFDPRINSTTLENLHAEIELFTSTLGYEIVATIQEVDASFLKDMRYKIIKSRLTPKRRETSIKAGIECYYRENTTTKSDKYQTDDLGLDIPIAQAVANILSAVEAFDNVTLLLGQLVIIKYTDNKGKSDLFTKIISLEFQNQLSSNPTLLSNPYFFIRFLDKKVGLLNKRGDKKISFVQDAVH